MVRVYLELSALIALANSHDLFHGETKRFLDEIKRTRFEPISCKQAVEMDLAIGVAKRPLTLTDALKIIETIDTCEIKLLNTQSKTLLLLVKEYQEEAPLKIGDLYTTSEQPC